MPTINQNWRNLNAGRRDVLVALAAHEPVNGKTLHEHIRGPHNPSTEAATQRLLDKLQQEGLVERETWSEDERYLINSLTDDGVEMVHAFLDTAKTVREHSTR